MEKYSLEVESWGTWELEKDFSNSDRARRHGLENFAQNEWRIIDRLSGNVVYTHNPNAVLEESARAELRRFSDTERWRQRFAERAAAEVVARQNREHTDNVAARQRARQRENDQRRRDRLQGFNFTSGRPRVLDAFEASEHAMDLVFGGGSTRSRGERVNWIKEGF
jgi:hypothetical protein